MPAQIAPAHRVGSWRIERSARSVRGKRVQAWSRQPLAWAMPVGHNRSRLPSARCGSGDRIDPNGWLPRGRTARDLERPPQKIRIGFFLAQCCELRHQCPAMWRPISVRSASLARASWTIRRGTSRPDGPKVRAIRQGNLYRSARRGNRKLHWTGHGQDRRGRRRTLVIIAWR